MRTGRPRSTYWTPERDAFVRENFAAMTALEIAAALGDTSIHAVRKRWTRLGLHKRPLGLAYKGMRLTWTEEQDAFVRANYHRMTTVAIGAVVGHSAEAVVTQARRLGVARKIRRWTPAEDAVILRLYGVVSERVIRARLSCTRAALHHRALTLGVKAADNRASAMQSVLAEDGPAARRLRLLLAVAHHGLLTPEEVAPALGCRPAEVHKLIAREAALGARSLEQEMRA